jgi:hypothetical protein
MHFYNYQQLSHILFLNEYNLSIVGGNPIRSNTTYKPEFGIRQDFGESDLPCRQMFGGHILKI